MQIPQIFTDYTVLICGIHFFESPDFARSYIEITEPDPE